MAISGVAMSHIAGHDGKACELADDILLIGQIKFEGGRNQRLPTKDETMESTCCNYFEGLVALYKIRYWSRPLLEWLLVGDVAIAASHVLALEVHNGAEVAWLQSGHASLRNLVKKKHRAMRNWF